MADAGNATRPVAGDKKAIVFLHGIGRPESTNPAWGNCYIWKNFETDFDLPKNVQWVLPTAPVQPGVGGQEVPSWYEIAGVKLPYHNTEAGATQDELDSGRSLVYKMIRDLNAEGVQSKDIIVAGFSQGACLAVYAAFSRESDEDALAGCVALSGVVMPAMEARIREANTAVKNTKLFWHHGSADHILLPENFGPGIEMLNRWGVGNMTLAMYPGLKHFTNAEERATLKEFIVAQLGL